MKIWSCKIGEVDVGLLPTGADHPMRRAVEEAYQRLTGQESQFIFSGWGAELTEGERAVVENRMPQERESKLRRCSPEIERELHDKEARIRDLEAGLRDCRERNAKLRQIAGLDPVDAAPPHSESAEPEAPHREPMPLLSELDPDDPRYELVKLRDAFDNLSRLFLRVRADRDRLRALSAGVPEAQVLGRTIESALQTYRLQHQVDWDNDHTLGIIDVLTPDTDKDVMRGRDECRLLADHILNELDRALSQSEQGRVPEGWKLVPVEPTEEMVDAGVDAECPPGCEGAVEEVVFTYRAMLAAAPQPNDGESDD